MPVQRPNLIYLVHRFPYPPNRGDRIRSFHILKFLVEHFNVYLGTLWDEEPSSPELEYLEQMCADVAAYPIGKHSRWLRAAGSMATGNSATEGLFHSPALRQHVQTWLTSVNFDCGLVFCSSMFPYLEAAKQLPLIVDLVDVDSQKWFDYADEAQGFKNWLFQLEGRRLRRLERRVGDRASAVVLVSEAEAKLFRAFCPNDHTSGILNGVDLEYFQPLPGDGRSASCVFIGALDYRANVDGIRWFCREVWPLVRTTQPHATLAIVGRNPGLEVRQLADLAGVEVFGSVPDVRPYLSEASIAIAPLRIARGIQNKLLEAMACRRAVVASPAAMNGLEAIPNEHLVVADTPESWSKAIFQLSNDLGIRRARAAAGRTFVERYHNWKNCLRPFENLLDLPVPIESPDCCAFANKTLIPNRFTCSN